MRRRRALSLLLAVTLLGCGDDDDGVADDTTSTTAPPRSTTTTTPSSTVAPTTSSSSPAPSALALRGDGLEVIDLGAAPDAAIAAVTAALGAPTLDTGWESSFSSYGTCPGEQIRAVAWGGLVLLHTDGATDVGTGEHLFSWRITGAPPAVATEKGLGVGATAADAEELYPGQVEVVPAQDPFPGFLEIQAEGGIIRAFLGDDGEITNLEAGVTCGE